MSDSLFSTGRSLYQLSFEISPIILTGGIAALIPGQMLPIVALTQALSFTEGLLSGANVTDLNSYFAHFKALPGSDLINNKIGEYPFASQTVAANAIIVDALNLSVEMMIPLSQEGAYAAKLATMTILKTALDYHINQGGLFSVATPVYIYTNLVLLRLHDTSTGDSHNAQTKYQFDFRRPLVTASQVQSVLSSLMNKLSGGLVTDGTSSGGGATLGSTLSNATPSLLPSAANLPAAIPNFVSAAPIPVSQTSLP